MDFLDKPAPRIAFGPIASLPIPLPCETCYGDDEEINSRLEFVKLLDKIAATAETRFRNSEHCDFAAPTDLGNIGARLAYSQRLSKAIQEPTELAGMYREALCDAHDGKYWFGLTEDKLYPLRGRILDLDKHMNTFDGCYLMVSPELRDYAWAYARLRISVIYERYLDYIPKRLAVLGRLTDDVEPSRSEWAQKRQLLDMTDGLIRDLTKTSDNSAQESNEARHNRFPTRKLSTCATLLGVDRETMFFSLIHHSEANLKWLLKQSNTNLPPDLLNAPRSIAAKMLLDRGIDYLISRGDFFLLAKTIDTDLQDLAALARNFLVNDEEWQADMAAFQGFLKVVRELFIEDPFPGEKDYRRWSGEFKLLERALNGFSKEFVADVKESFTVRWVPNLDGADLTPGQIKLWRERMFGES